MKHRFIKTVSALFLVMTLLFSSTIFAFADSTDTWNTKAPMSTARDSFQTVVMNGKIYAIGGRANNEHSGSIELLSSVEEYDPATNIWTKKAPMQQGREFFQTAVIDNKIYAIGGDTLGSSLSSVEEYDPQTDKWTIKKSMNAHRTRFQTEVVNGKIYAIGGFTYGQGGLDSVEEYDPKTDTWTMKASMSCERYQFNTVLINGMIYAIGGEGGIIRDNEKFDGFQMQIEAYDVQQNKWFAKTSLIEGKRLMRSSVVNGKIYIIGGYNEADRESNTVEEYDPSTNICSSKSSMHQGRACFSAATVNGQILALGGVHSNAVEEYNPQTDIWTQKAAVPTLASTYYYSCADVIDNNIYAIGGDSAGTLNNTWIYSLQNNSVTLTATASPNKVKVGQQFTTDIAIHNETNICAEDIKLTYDKNLFEYEGATGQTGTKIYKEDASTPGTIRFITACQGKDTAATGDKGLITLKFKAKAKGVGKVDIIKGRIADNATLEEDVADENCGEDTITVDGYQDVNRSGNFTLLDLGIDAYYDGMNASDTDSTKYDTDVIPDGKIDDNDLAQITQEILANKDYAPNN